MAVWQAIGATTPFFTALLGLVILRERETALVYASLIPVVIGAQPPSALSPDSPLHCLGLVMVRETVLVHASLTPLVLGVAVC